MINTRHYSVLSEVERKDFNEVYESIEDIYNHFSSVRINGYHSILLSELEDEMILLKSIYKKYILFKKDEHFKNSLEQLEVTQGVKFYKALVELDSIKNSLQINRELELKKYDNKRYELVDRTFSIKVCFMIPQKEVP